MKDNDKHFAIVYRKDGKIHRVEKAPELYGGKELREMAVNYNARCEHEKVETIEIAAGSTEDWMLTELTRRRSIRKEYLMDALRALDEARNAIEEMECAYDQ